MQKIFLLMGLLLATGVVAETIDITLTIGGHSVSRHFEKPNMVAVSFFDEHMACAVHTAAKNEEGLWLAAEIYTVDEHGIRTIISKPKIRACWGKQAYIKLDNLELWVKVSKSAIDVRTEYLY